MSDKDTNAQREPLLQAWSLPALTPAPPWTRAQATLSLVMLPMALANLTLAVSASPA
jgi:hypothetical protein